MTYKESLTAAMDDLARNPATVFVGYGLTTGRAMGTLRNVPAAQIIETPVAENLMVGLAIGMSLRGKLPVVFIERADFLLNAMDAIVNHLDKIALLSAEEFRPAVILRVVVGNREKPLFTGATHTQDTSEALRCMVSFPVYSVFTPEVVTRCYAEAAAHQRAGISTAVFEYKDEL